MDTEYYYDFVTMAPIFEYTVYDDDTREMKVVFDNGGIQITDEPDNDYAEDYEAATDEEIEALYRN